ncbi:MAG: sulfurtransferase [Gemmataceae bacterium]
MHPKYTLLIAALVATVGRSWAGDDAYPRANLLAEPVQLSKANGFVILDAREKEKYSAGHIPGARWVDHEAWAKSFGHGDDADRWTKRIGALGIGNDTKVIVYDDNSHKDAARIWWQLRYWGVEDVRLLNGGWTGWKVGGYPIEKDEVVPVAVKYEAKARTGRLATKEQLVKSLRDGSIQIVDARSEGEHCGVEKMKNKRAGAMPGARHLEWSDLIDSDTKRFKSSAELTKLFDVAGIDLTRTTATHGQSGGRAAVMAFGLELIGAKDVSNYYRSWSEWGNTEDTPVVPGKVKKRK